MSCPRCGGDNEISALDGLCTKCDMKRVNRVCHDIFGSSLWKDNDFTTAEYGGEIEDCREKKKWYQFWK